MATVTFRVPVAEAGGLGRGQWIWDLSGWPGVGAASLDGLFGSLTVRATPKAMRRVRQFCAERGYPEER